MPKEKKIHANIMLLADSEDGVKDLVEFVKGRLVQANVKNISDRIYLDDTLGWAGIISCPKEHTALIKEITRNMNSEFNNS